MRLNERETIGSLLEAGDPGDWAALLDRMGDELAPALWRAVLVDACVDAAIATRRPAYLNAVVNNHEVLRRRPELVERLASDDHPVERVAYTRTLSEPRLRRRWLAATRPATPAWTAQDGLVPWLLSRTDVQELRPTVVCAFPDLVRHALVTLGPKLTRAEQLRGLLSLYAHAGPDEVLATVQDAELSADVIRLAQEAVAAADGESLLRAATEEAESTAALIDDLYRIDSGRQRPRGGGTKGALLSATDLVNARTELDWPALIAAHARQPFSKESTVLPLVQRSDCPQQMLTALLTASPRVTSAARWAEIVAEGALRKGLSGAKLLEVSQLAKGVLAVSRRPDNGLGWAEFHTELRTLVRDRLGANVPAWRELRARLADHPGTVGELIDESIAAAAVAVAGNDDALLGEPWPDSDGLPDPRRGRGDLPMARAAFLVLLEAAGTEAHLALLPCLDDLTVFELVVTGSWKPELAEHIVTAGSPRDRLVLARRKGLTPDWIGRLLAWDDPEVDTSLFFQYQAADRQRRGIVAGVSAGPGRTGQLPLPPQIRDYMLGKRSSTSWVADFTLACGDPVLLRHVLRYVGAKARDRRLRVFAGLWRRHGPGEVRALLAEDFSGVKGHRTKQFEPELRTLLDELLALPDEAAALDRLRAHTLVAMLREGGAFKEDVVAVELPGWDWDTVLAAHRQRKFTKGVLSWLASWPGCPAELAEGVQPLADLSVGSQATAAASGSQPAEPAVSGTSQEPGEWIRALAVKPVGVALSQSPPLSEWKRQTVADALAPIKGNLDAWVLLLRMLPNFPGSLAELVATAERALQ